MAQAMQEVFGEMLLTHPVDKNEKQLPSPFQLKRKIVLKHKKLPDGSVADSSVLVRNDDGRDMDLRNTVKNGIMYLEDQDREWNPHFFVLTHDKLIFTDSFQGDQETDIEEEEPQNFQAQREGVPNDELHFGEKWFHGKLKPNGRDEAESLLRKYSHLGDGTFLVRESETFVGDHSLSFW